MIRSVICLVAEGVIRDAQTSNISVFNILEGLTAEGFPVFVQRLSFFALFERDVNDPSQANARFTIILNGQNLQEREISLDFQGKLKTRVMINLQSLVISQPGRLTFSLTLPTGAVASYMVEANAVSGALPEVAPSPQQ